MSKITVETTVRRWYNTESDEVSVSGTEEREIEISREVPDVETFVNLLECSRNEAVRYVWDEIKDEPEWEEWGWHGPYAQGDITLSASRTGVTWHDVVDYIAERENADDRAGVYLSVEHHARTDSGSTHMNAIRRRFLRYLADERGIDTSYWTHGEKPRPDSNRVF